MQTFLTLCLCKQSINTQSQTRQTTSLVHKHDLRSVKAESCLGKPVASQINQCNIIFNRNNIKLFCTLALPYNPSNLGTTTRVGLACMISRYVYDAITIKICSKCQSLLDYFSDNSNIHEVRKLYFSFIPTLAPNIQDVILITSVLYSVQYPWQTFST